MAGKEKYRPISVMKIGVEMLNKRLAMEGNNV